MKNLTCAPANHNDDQYDKEAGSALITLLFFATIITLAAGNIAGIAHHKVHFTRIINDRTSAQQIAEGAAAQALAYIAEEPLYLTQPPSIVTGGSLGNGTYEVSIESGLLDIFTIVSTGTVGEQSRTIKVHCLKPIDLEALGHAMFSNGDINIRGTGQITGGSNGSGNIHANQNTGMTGNTSISGSASATGSVTVRGAASVDGSILSGSREISFPKLDLDFYYAIAQKNNEVRNSDQHFSNTTLTPNGGVLWVTGDVTMSAHVTINGLLVATGDIHQAGHYTHNPVDDLPALISRDGKINMSGQTQIEGLIYTRSGRIEITGGTNLQGAVIAWGDITAAGNWGLIDFVEQEPVMEGENRIQVLAWEM